MADDVNKPFTSDDIVQEPSPLEYPQINLELRLAYENPEWWVKMAHWVNAHFPDVLSFRIYSKDLFVVAFTSTELYIEFCKNFPEVLRGEDK